MPCGRACGARQGHYGGAGIIRCDEQLKFPPLPCDRYPSSGHALPDLSPHRRLPAREPQNLSTVLTEHYRRAHPEALGLPSGRPSRRPSALSADAATGLPTRDELAAGLGRRTLAVTKRDRSMVKAHTKNRRYLPCCRPGFGWSGPRRTDVL